jgi:hypothetical protein
MLSFLHSNYNEVIRLHMKEEGENLKALLEEKRKSAIKEGSS